MLTSYQLALIARLTAMADDELILAHRNAEWTGHAPILEEDIALANLAQDELGHAMIWYSLLEVLTGKSGDEMAFFRDTDAFRNVQMMELPKGDWAFTMLRQYLFDAYEYVWLATLAESMYQPLAEAVAKIRTEELYHLRHTHVWVKRLGLGTAESNGRMQCALDTLWAFAGQLFVPMIADAVLIAEGIVPDVSQLRPQWEQIVTPHLEDSGLSIPETTPLTAGRDAHTEHLNALLADMQLVARADPTAIW